MNATIRIALTTSFLFAAMVRAQDCTEGIDWTKRTVCAKGIGAVNPKHPQAAARPGAIRAARR